MNGKKAKKLRRIVKKFETQDLIQDWVKYGTLVHSLNGKDVDASTVMLDPKSGKSVYRKLKNASN